jgi:hypothetical protein
MSKEIESLKEQIHELKEYLDSDICRSCGEISLKLDEYIQQLKLLMDQKDHERN